MCPFQFKYLSFSIFAILKRIIIFLLLFNTSSSLIYGQTVVQGPYKSYHDSLDKALLEWKVSYKKIAPTEFEITYRARIKQKGEYLISEDNPDSGFLKLEFTSISIKNLTVEEVVAKRNSIMLPQELDYLFEKPQKGYDSLAIFKQRVKVIDPTISSELTTEIDYMVTNIKRAATPQTRKVSVYIDKNEVKTEVE